MAEDQGGNLEVVGTQVWLPATVTMIGSNGLVVVTTAYSGASIALKDTDTWVDPGALKKPSNFPDLPGDNE